MSGLATSDALAAVRARLDQAYALKAAEAEPELTGDMYQE